MINQQSLAERGFAVTPQVPIALANTNMSVASIIISYITLLDLTDPEL